jgi:hypothetical protein
VARDLLAPAEVELMVETAISCATYVLMHGGEQGELLALGMRDEFVTQWECPRELWDERCAALLDYDARKGLGPVPPIARLSFARDPS